MRRIFTTLLTLVVAVGLSGCLGTVVQAPVGEEKALSTTHAHILAAPYRIDAHVCKRGMATVATFVPLWGLAVGILTFGIVVPKTTVYHCVRAQ